MNYLLDTNVISEVVAKAPHPNVMAWLAAHETDPIYLSVITLGELRKGVEKLPASARKDRLLEWLNQDLLARFHGRLLPLDTSVLLTWGRWLGQLEQRGRRVAAIDSLIGAQALAFDCVLVTRNTADFADTGVRLVNPWD